MFSWNRVKMLMFVHLKVEGDKNSVLMAEVANCALARSISSITHHVKLR
jgi:hypothetical protein